jgi:AmmeMemoRadiSam system protein B
LREQVDQFLAGAKLPELPGEVVAVVAPHAGLRYSGGTAGHAFAAVRGQQRDLVAVISPMHAPAPGSLLTTAHRAYATPLGAVRVDTQALAQLGEILAQEGLDLTALANDREHSLEIELPFLQRVVPGEFSIIPIMVRDQRPSIARVLGEAVASLLAELPGLIVASTDLSHFYPQEIADLLDAEMLRQVETFNPLGVFKAEENGKGFACGKSALAAALWAAKGLGADRVTILHHATSGDVTGDYKQVVGYGAAVFTRSNNTGTSMVNSG